LGSTLAASGGGAAAGVYQQIFEDERRVAEEYIHQQVEAIRERGVKVRGRTAIGEPSSTQIDLAQQERVSLVVMTTHGRAGMARFALGSVADRMVRYGTAPVLLLRSYGAECRADQLERALVALDGSPRAERALDVCRTLAGNVIRDLALVRAVDVEASERTVREAQQYLDEVVARRALEFGGRDCGLTTKALRGRPAEAILLRAERECDLIVIATHGRSGTARWALGSVADRVLQGARVPILLVRSA